MLALQVSERNCACVRLRRLTRESVGERLMIIPPGARPQVPPPPPPQRTGVHHFLNLHTHASSQVGDSF